MTGYRVVNLLTLIEEIGEDAAKNILSDFSCPINEDVEQFLRVKAIDFAKQGWAQTHLVYASYKERWVLVGYYALANKTICIKDKLMRTISNTLRKRLSKFARYEQDAKVYVLSAPLIGQLGKNFTNGYNCLITGDELLYEAINKIKSIQLSIGGRFAYLECEDKPKLIDFYKENGFCEFMSRPLDPDETGISGVYLVQMIKYIK